MAIARQGSADLGNNGSPGGSGATFSASYTVNSASNCVVFAVVGGFGSGSTETWTATYGGVTLSQPVQAASDGNCRTNALLCLMNPPTGSNTLSISGPNLGDNFILVVGADYSGVGAIGNSGKVNASGNVTSLSLSLTPNSANDWVVSSLYTPHTATNSNQTLVTYGSQYGLPCLFDTNGTVGSTGTFSSTFSFSSVDSNLAGLVLAAPVDVSLASQSWSWGKQAPSVEALLPLGQIRWGWGEQAPSVEAAVTLGTASATWGEQGASPEALLSLAEIGWAWGSQSLPVRAVLATQGWAWGEQAPTVEALLTLGTASAVWGTQAPQIEALLSLGQAEGTWAGEGLSVEATLTLGQAAATWGSQAPAIESLLGFATATWAWGQQGPSLEAPLELATASAEWNTQAPEVEGLIGLAAAGWNWGEQGPQVEAPLALATITWGWAGEPLNVSSGAVLLGTASWGWGAQAAIVPLLLGSAEWQSAGQGLVESAALTLGQAQLRWGEQGLDLPVGNIVLGAAPLGWAGAPFFLAGVPATIGYTPAPLRGQKRSDGAADAQWVGRLAQVVNNSLRGALNVTTKITIPANTTSTTITDARISVNSALVWTPTTPDAAALQGSMHVSSQQSGEAVLTYQSTGDTDCNFNLLIIG